MNRTKWNNQATFHVGDTIKVHQNIAEGKKTRTQVFKGIVIRIKGHQGLKSFTVRKISKSGGIGVERIYPLEAPIISKIEVVKSGKVKRAKLYYLRDRIGKKATKVQDNFVKKQEIQEAESVAEKLKSAPEEPETDTDTKKAKTEVKPPEASTKAELKKEARARRKAKKKKKLERKERKDIR